MATQELDEEAIFNVARKIDSPEAREGYLRLACGGDDGLRARVVMLLQVYDQEQSFLAAPGPVGTVDEPAIADRVGTTIGPYKLLEVIGEGGMGTVFVAEQTEPVARRVALKVIKPGMDTKEVVARFEAERQALALMEHPNIAKVFDAGSTDAGRPYFVMELVRGLPITDYCDQARLTTAARLRLFAQVCRAVQHAHQKGVIHRDLKPSNVLVTLHDGEPVPKVIDFGVAKAVNQRLTAKTVYTRLAQLVGTPLYMSPEQAELSGLDIDTRSDVYSLGVLLYELLTGTTPFDAETLRQVGFDEMRRMIREDEPLRPSHRLSTLAAEAQSTVSQRRGVDGRRLGQSLRGELDWIVMRALEKDRTRRYESASAFAADVQRYLGSEPVEACPPTAGYKLRKFARKNKRLLATAAGFAALLLLGVAASAWQAVRATRAEVAALENEQKANHNAAQANLRRDEVQALNEQLQAMQAQRRSTLYAAHMNLAKHAWDEVNIGRVLELLDQQRPKSGEPDLRHFEWNYLNRLCHSELLTFKGHTGGVRSIAFSPDGKSLASASGSEVKVWDAQTGRELFPLKGHTGVARSNVAFSPDGKRLATWGSPSPRGGFVTVKVWDAQTGQELHTLQGGGGSVTFSPDGQRLAGGSKVWDAQTGRELLNLTDVNVLGFSSDGKRLAGVSRARATQDMVAKVWDAQTGDELFSFKGSYMVAFSPDGKCLVTATEDETLKVWDARTGQYLRPIQAYAEYSIVFSPDGKRLANIVDGREGGAVQVWDTQTGEKLLHLKGAPSASLSTVVFSPDGKRLASAWDDGAVKMWDAQTGQVIRTFYGHSDSVKSVVFSPDGQRLASSSTDTTVKVWDVQQRDPEAPTLNLDQDSDAFAFSPDFGRLASATSDNTVRVWDARTGKPIFTLKGHAAPVRNLAFSPDGKRLASGAGGVRTPDGAVVYNLNPLDRAELMVWDTQTGDRFQTFPVSLGAVVSVAFSPDGQRLASATAGPPPSRPSLAV